MQLLEMFGACYCYVLVRAFQQRNVAFANYLWVFPTSMCMAVFDVFLVAFIAHAGWSIPVVVANGTGGALGCLSAIFLHRKYVKNHEKP